MNTTPAEIDLFISLYLRIRNAVRSFWAENTRWELVADFMARNRFEKLASTMHLVNNLEVTEEDKKDKVHKLKP